MIIGTTPTFTFKLRRNSNIDLTAASKVFVTFKQGTTVLTKTGNDIHLVDGKTVQVSLNQEESLGFVIDKNIEVQVNWIYNTNGVITRAATKVKAINLDKQLLRQVLS